MTGDRKRRAWLLPLVLVLVLAVSLSCSSCAKRSASTPPAQQNSTQPGSAASHGPTPGDLPAHWNSDELTKVDLSSHDFTFAVFGDNRGSTKVFPALISRVNSEGVLFALDNGDLVDSGTVANYRLFLGQIAASTKPFLTAIGNHEDEPGYNALFGPSYYDFTIGDSLFIMLDDSNERDIDGAQLEWLKSKLAAGQSQKYRFVIMHVPLYDPRLSGERAEHSLSDLDFVHRLNALFDQNHVTLLITSHIHGYFEGVWGATPYILTAGAGAPLYGTDPAHFFYHYVLVHVSDQGVTHQVVKI
jgi:Calcineurin-like phosphoesterase